MVPERGALVVAACNSGGAMAREIVQAYRGLLKNSDSSSDLVFLEEIERRFFDGETCIRIDHHVGGSDVFLVQSLFNPHAGSINENYLAFLAAARAFRENGAKHITGIIPYLAYGRQDKPTRLMREPTTAKLMADLSIGAGIDRIVTWHPHSKQIQGFYGTTPVAMLEPDVFFTEELARFRGRGDVILVAPDEGASKLVTSVARELNLSSAIAAKFRLCAQKVERSEIIGNFTDKSIVILIDDIIGSGQTVKAAISEVRKKTDVRELYLCASHHLCLPQTKELFSALAERSGLKNITVTNSIPQTNDFLSLPFFTMRSLSEIMARVINRVHYSRSISEIFQTK